MEKIAVSRLASVSFPSPFGVHVLKCAKAAAYDRIQTDVSVPFRGSCSEMQVQIMSVSSTEEFPSPFGVHVLKFDIKLLEDCVKVVSVPFRGSCSEILACILLLSPAQPTGFRPLSGFMF